MTDLSTPRILLLCGTPPHAMFDKVNRTDESRTTPEAKPDYIVPTTLDDPNPADYHSGSTSRSSEVSIARNWIALLLLR
jgi:hypothetical protein